MLRAQEGQIAGRDTGADGALVRAVWGAAGRLRSESPAAIDEGAFSGILCQELRTALQLEVRANTTGGLTLAQLRGVGGFDVVGYARGEPVYLAELKWSKDTREKIFEATWDAVKLALAIHEHPVTRRCWLVTGASEAAWRDTETP
jgi:hypothetical protein